MNLKLKKVYSVSKKGKPERPRIFLQHLICETAGFQPKGEIYIKVSEETEEVILQNFPFESEEDIHIVHVSSRKSKISEQDRPLLDTAGERYSFLDINQKIEVNVYKQGTKGKVVIKPLEYKLFENNTIPTPKDQRIRFLSVCAGAGVGTSILESTNYYTPVQEIELEDDSAEVLLHNFPNSTVFNGDLRDCMDVAEVDMAFITLPCNEFSVLGNLTSGIMDDLILATSKIIQSSKAEILFFENVPSFFKSTAWDSLKSLLQDDYPFWSQKDLESWDFGSVATRKRTYSLAFRNEDRFLHFQFPTPPKGRRKKLKDFLDRSDVKHEWKSVEKWMDSFNSREAWKDRSLERTFVDKNVDRISCIPKRYTAQCASNSHVLSDDKKFFRFLSINEIKRILDIPETFTFTENTQKIRRYEMLGQSVDGRVIKAIANRIAYTFMKVKSVATEEVRKIQTNYSINNGGQLELLLT